MLRWGLALVVVLSFSRIAFAGDDPFGGPAARAEGAPAPAENRAAPPPVVPVPTAAPTAAPRARAVAPIGQIADTDHVPAARKRHKVGLMIAGLAIFGAGYVGSVLSMALSSAAYGNAAALGPEMLVPIAGPWLGLASTNWDAVPSDQRDQAQVTLVLQGGLQAVGAVLSIVGISQYVSSKDADGPRRVAIQFAPTQGGAFGMVRGVF